MKTSRQSIPNDQISASLVGEVLADLILSGASHRGRKKSEDDYRLYIIMLSIEAHTRIDRRTFENSDRPNPQTNTSPSPLIKIFF